LRNYRRGVMGKKKGENEQIKGGYVGKG